MRIAILGLPLMTCLASPVWAGVDTSTFSQRIEQAGYQEDVQGLEALHAELEDATARPQSDKYLYYYLGYVDYALTNQYAATDAAKAGKLLDSAEDALNAALKADAGFAEAEALLGACYGFEISFHPIRAMFLGPKSSSHIDRALRLAPEDPRVLLFKAVSDFNTPAAFGGDKQKALWGFHRALVAFDSYHPADAAAPTWGKAQTYEWLGYAEEDEGQKEAARADYSKALALSPAYKKAQRHLDKLPPPATAASSIGSSI